ncbi:ATP-binding protein [Nocardia otitidiscaviarum]|uniref:ATP-binding protein n=1 Tax=Nocardia otitidiscaviarum TaxID=1823 RepID=UPI0004A74BE3|nr:ATP-binding protein [Nocardia otitidiscaviarum]MBF6132720.1 ATP-binding protein [Nocardia otitidiscaviarum]MBF6486139.1 ATP-binding protein [Nocardia otitidiscaviarum]
MNEEQRHALASIQFSSVLGPDQVWSPLTYHVDGLHSASVEVLTHAVRAARNRPRSMPTGLVLSGEKGVGKTHMLGWLRRHVQDQGGAFFMPKLIDGESFWAGAVHGIVTQLRGSDGGQLGRMLTALAESTGCGPELGMRLRGTMPVSRGDLDEFLDRVEDLDAQVAAQCRDTLRALVLYQARRNLGEIGLSFLTLPEGIDESDRAAWGFRRRERVPQLVFGDMCRLFALTGPVVLAIDQIDSLIAQSGRGDADQLANRLADGLMRMREETVRTLIVAACIPKSWELLTARAVNSAADRFTVLELSTAMPSEAVATAIVERHLGSLYADIGFEPPYPTWPVLPRAFDDPEVAMYTPRRLLQRVEEHVRGCLAANTIGELTSFGLAAPAADPTRAIPAAGGSTTLDERFVRLRAGADVAGPLDPAREDDLMFSLLNSALACYVLEQPSGGQQLTVDPPTLVRPALHARLRRTLDEASEDEEHWSFRAIAHGHARAVLTRLRSACLEAGIGPRARKRHLVIVRNTPYSSGPATRAALAELEVAQGLSLSIDEEDLRTFSALHTMYGEAGPEFHGWLTTRRPASESRLFRRVLADAVTEAVEPPATVEQAAPPPAVTAPDAPDDAERPMLTVGRQVDTGAAFQVPLHQLRKHTAVFAGSGSGKTVLLRRLVEEVALHGVSSILIDTNNDLARLGDSWPAAPDAWGRADAELAERYFSDTEVIVWTPRREAGRPLALNPLPDFGDVLDDPDEFRTAIDASVAGLLPRTGLTAAKLRTGTAVLTEALTHFAREHGTELNAFVELLAALPEGVSSIRNAARLASGMADELNAAMINDPVFGGDGERLDPGTLLTPAPGRRARISVISCIGLPTTEQRQTFVNQLELALFAWIKRHPAGDRPLGGLLVLDEAQTFAPSRGTTASTASTLQLATQARKYGLGMVYATQAPKALHNLVTGNAATQFIGLLNASVQIQAAQELARAKGGRVDDIARLPAGRFYGAGEGSAFRKITTPMCLSHHPPSALTEEEVLARARREPR